MTDEQNRPPRTQGTVFRPSPLQGLQGGQAGRPEAILLRPGLSSIEVDDEVPGPAALAHIRNPLMAQAGPFLALISRARLGDGIENIDAFHERALRRLRAFSTGLERHGTNSALARNASYALAATMDDVVQNLPGRAGGDWARRSMVVMMFAEAVGGDKFWELLNEMLRRPADNAELLEVFHACIAAGFEGRYRVASDGSRKRGEAMAAAFSALPHVRRAVADLSPSWRGSPMPMRKFGYWPVVLAVGACALLLCFLVWLPLRLMLGEAAQPARTAITDLLPSEGVSIAGEAPAAELPASDRLTDLKRELAEPVGQGMVEVENKVDGIHVRILAPGMFRSGSAEIEAEHLHILGIVAAAIDSLDPSPGELRIEGHTDTDPPRSIEYNNDQLSQARADAALDALKGRLKASTRSLNAIGKGDRFPVRSVAEKEQNRRIEVVVPRSD